ncbi:S-layer family protein [Mesorhizobium sp. B2-6-4]|uniref:beta strand repeat-containing protein n=1 Tax=Mesorhizobium sp. B2-6-4 TaxID=2589913 RepID=UPI00112A05D1|nr:S-layer family protein [Mesorhizobium sp. B2-6-4]TPJ55586.1 S-layer family protein [Mesorhizobium sp. B2-6-4]
MAARGEDFRVRVAYGRSRFARHLWKTTALSTLAVALSGVAAYGDDVLWQPQIRAIIGADNNGGNAALEGFIPIKQTAESVLFLDVRAKHDFKDAFGQDVGLGIRRIINPDLMLGGYAYLNVENYNSNQFTSATLGAEAITPHFDAHVNVFVPIKGDTTDHSVSSTLSMVSNQLVEQISVLDHRDYAAWGIEGEIGARVPLNLPDKHSLRLDIGGYHFEDPHGDDSGVTGVKAGIEYEIGDVFGTGTALTFTGEVRNDNRDDTQFAGSVRLSIPFNPGQGGADSGPEPVYPVSEGLRKRVNERVRGDIGVRIQSQELPGGSTTRVAINAATNAAFGKFYYADGGLAGAGTLADPTTLDDAVTKAGTGGFVVALGGNGNITTTGTTLADGQTVIGGGQSVTARLFGGGTGTFNLGGSNGTIQGTSVANNVITLGNGDTLNGITITGGADGIFGNNITGATLTNVTVTGAGGNGAAFTGNSTGITGSNFTATGNGLDGLHIEGDGTYNFAGTTLLQGNSDDGLDATGHGTYTFATLSAKDNADRGITVQGTSTSGSFATTGGTVSGNGGVGVFIDPITAHVVLDSIDQTGGPSGVVLDHVAGSFAVTGATTISDTTGPAIAISNSPAAIRFGDIDISAPAGDGISFTGVNAAVVAGDIVISGLGVGTGLDFSGSHTNFTAQSLNIAGTGAAGSIGIDLASPTSGGASIVITDGGAITGVGTGVRFGISGSLLNSANAEFSFGGGSIAGSTASLDARGLNQTLGHYAFGSTTFSGPQLFDQQNVIFVGAAATGSGTGSSLLDLASIADADANTDGTAIFVLVNRGTIDDTDGFSLSAGQTLASFGNGRTFSLGGIPVNVTGDNIAHTSAISDGAGAATLTSSAGADTVTLANNSALLDFNVSNANPGGGNGVHGNNVTGVTISGMNVSGAGLDGLLFEGASNVATNNVTSTSNASEGLHIDGDGSYAFTGTTTLSNNAGNGLFVGGDGTYAFQTLNASDNSGFGVNVLSTTGTFSTTDGTISGNGAAGVALLGANLDVKLASLTQDGGLFGATLAGVSGNFAVSGATTISNTVVGGLGIFDSTADFMFGAVDISDITAPGGIGIDVQNSGGAVTFGGPVMLTHIGSEGILATDNTGTLTFSGPVSMTGPGDGVWLENNTGAVSFGGAVTIDQPLGSGIDVVGSNGVISFDDIDITGLCNCSTALDLSGSTSTFTAATLDISGSSGGSSIGVDLSGTNGGSVTIGSGVITGVDTGVQMGTNGLAGTTASTAFSFGAAGGASITGVIASLDMRGLLPGSGTYAFNGTHLVGPQLFDAANVVFVGSSSTGTGDGSSVANLIDAAAADDLTTNANTTFVLVKTAAVQTTDTDANGFTLASGQSLVSFANGATISLGGPPANVTGTAVVTGATQADPFGFGGATLNNGGGNTIDLASGNTVSNLSVNSSFLAIDGTASINGLTSTGVTIVGGTIGLYLGSASGAITVNDLTIQGSVPTGVVLANTSATVDFTGTTTIAGGSNIALLVNNFGGTANFADLDISGGSGLGIVILNGSSGSLTFGAASSIDNTGASAIVIGSSSADVTYDGTISQSSAAKAVRIDGTTGGLITFGGAITSTGTGGLFDIGEITAPTDTAIRFTGPLTATGGGGASITSLGADSTFEVSGTLSITGTTGAALSISNAAGSATFGTTNVTLGATSTTGIDFSGTNNDVSFGTTTVSGLGAGASQTAIDFSGSATTADFGLTTITGNDAASSRGIDLTSTTGNRTITFLTGSSISGAGIGVDLSSGQTAATSANASFTFGDGEFADANGRNSTITAAAGNFTVNTVGLAALGNYDFDDVLFTGSANLASAVGGVFMVSQNGGVIAAGSFGLSTSVNTISVADADLKTGTQTFAFVGTVDLSGTPFTLDSGQSITGFGNGNAITTTGTIQPVNVQGNLGATGGDVTGDEGVVKSTGSDTLHLLGSNQVRNTAFDFTGGSGSVFTIDQSAGSFNNAGGIVIEGVTVGNVGAGQTAFKVAGLDSNLSITNNNVNVAGTLLDVDGGAGNITVTRGILPNSGPAGTLTGGGISIANHGGGLINFTDKVTVGGNGVSLTNNAGTVNFTDVDISTNGATAFSASGVGTVNVLTGTVNATNAQAVALDGIAGNIDFASTSASFGSGSGIDLQNLSGTFNFGTGTLTNTGLGTAFNVGSGTNASGGNANISYAGAIVSKGTGAAVSIQELTGGSVTLSGNLTDGLAGAGGNIVVAGIDNGTAATVTFSGATKQISSGATDGVSLIGNPNATIGFGNGGLDITTTAGAGFGAGSGGTISISGTGNTITTTTGTALDLDGATVGAGGVIFDSVSVNGAATGVSLNNIVGGAIDLGAVDLQNITSRGVDISGTLGSTLGFDSLNIGLNAANAVGFDLNGAALGTSNIKAGDFDVDGGSFAGTIGIDMAGTTGTGTIQLGDTANNNPAGQTSKIENVGYGVQFSSATNARLVFGDGAGLAESTIATTGGQAIHAIDTLPTNGDYNFNDVTFTGDTSNLSAYKVYYVTTDATGGGDGSFVNPGTYANAQASTANVIVLIDKNGTGSQETIDLSGTSFQLDDGQVLLAFGQNDTAIDVSQLGVDTSSGASAAFHFTTVQNSPIIAAPAGIDTLRPILQSNTAGSVITLATSGPSPITGGIENLIIRNTGTGAGVAVDASTASSFFLRNNDISAGGRALDFSTTGAAANTLLLSIDGNTLRSTGSALAASFAGQNISATDNSIAIRSFAGNTVLGGTGGGIAFDNVTFDSTGAGGTVSAGTLDVGTSGARVQGNGLAFTSTSGTLDLGTFTTFNDGGTGVLVDTKGPPATTFALNSSGGTVDTINGVAFNLDPLTVSMIVNSVNASGGASGIIFDGVAGTFTVTGATTVTGTTGAGISSNASNPTGTFNFNTVTVNNTASTGGGIGWESGTLNVGGLADIDTTSGAGLFQGGGTTSFNGGLTIDTTTGAGITGPGGTINIIATAGSETVNSTSYKAIDLTNAALDVALDSTSSGGGGVVLTNVTGTAGLGTGTLSGGGGTAFSVGGGTVSTTYGGNITQAGNAALVSVSAGHTGTLTFSGTLSANNGTGLQFDNADGTYNFNGTTTLNGGDAGIDIVNNSGGTFNFGTGTSITNPNSTAFNVDASAANITYSGNITQAGNAALVAIAGHTAGTITFQTGTLSATNGTGLQFDNADGIYNFNGTTTLNGGNASVDILNDSDGTFGFGVGTSITSPNGTAFSVDGGNATVTYAGTITQGTGGQRLIVVADTTGGAVNFTTALANGLNDTSGTGIVVDGAAGNVTVNNASLTGTTGITILGDAANNATGTYTFNNVAIDTVAGALTNHAFAVDGDQGTFTNGDVSATINLNNVDITNPGGNVANIRGMAGGSVNFDNASSITRNDGGLGIVALSNSGGTINFGGASKTLSTGANAAVLLTSNAGATINFTNGGLAITTTSGIGIGASGGGTVSVTGSGNTISTGSGAAVDMDTVAIGAGGMTFASTNTSAGGGSAVILDAVTGGPVNLGGGALVGGGSATIRIGDGAGSANTGGTAAFTYAGTITSGTGQAVNIQDRAAGAGNITLSGNISHNVAGQTGVLLDDNAAGTITFSGASKSITSGSAAGVNLTDNTGATINFTNGGLAITSSSGTGFGATGGGTVTVTTGANPNTITSGTGTALNVANTTIGASGLTFRSISANGAVNGIVLNNTGTIGGLTVTGSGSTVTDGSDSSGGTIQNATGVGISLVNTTSASFTNMLIQNTTGSGVLGTSVHGFTFNNGKISGSNSDGNVTTEEANISFATTTAGTENNIDGTISIAGNLLTTAQYHGVDIFNFSGTIDNLTVSNNTITSATAAANSQGSGIRVVAFGSAATVASIVKATIDNNHVNNFPGGTGIQVQGGNANAGGPPTGFLGHVGSATDIIAITNNVVAGQSAANRIATFGISATVNGRGQGNFNIGGNSVSNTIGNGINVGSFGFANVFAKVNNNTLDLHNQAGAAGIGAGTSQTFGSNTETPTMTIYLDNNIVHNSDGNGILVTARDASGTVNAHITNNHIDAPLSGNRNGIRVDAGNAVSGNETMNLEIFGNTSAGSGLSPEGIGLRKQGTVATINTFNLYDAPGGPSLVANPTTAQVVSFIGALNPGSAVNGGTGDRVLIISGDAYQVITTLVP